MQENRSYIKIINKVKSLSKNQLCFIAIEFFLMAYGVFKIGTNDSIISKNVTVNAVITDTDLKNDWIYGEKRDGKNDYDITYQYNGKTYSNRITTNEMSAFNSKHRDDIIRIYIDPENPERIAIRSDKFGYICIFAAVIAWFTAYIMGHKKEAHYKNYY